MPLYQPVDLTSVSDALGELATEGQVFKADGLGSGIMTKNTQYIKNRLTVGQVGSDCDFTPTAGYGAIAAAVATAIAGGVSSSNPWQIDVYPGVYAEPKTILPVGLYLRGSQTRMDTVFVVPVDPNDDLFVSQGGHISGLHLAGVTGAGKWLFNCSIEGSFSTALDVAIHGCSGGTLVANGAQIVCTNYSVIIGGPDMHVGTALSVDGTGALSGMKSYAAIQGFFAVVPAAVLPYYTTNPVQKGFSVTNGGEGFIATGSFRLPSIDNTTSSVFVDSGGFAFVSATEVANANVAVRIGSSGSNSKMLTQACNFQDNTTDVKIESATGKVFLSQSGDGLTSDLVEGARIIGNIQNRDTGFQSFIGNAEYQFFGTNKTMSLSNFINSETSTGLIYGGVVSAATGLYVDVTAGKGLIRRGDPNYDAWDVSWDLEEDVALQASTTNYVYYNATTEEIAVATSAPGETGILLATVITDGSGIRFLHNTKTIISQFEKNLYSYLSTTRKVMLSSGLAVSEGSTARKLNVSSGEYFISLTPISFTGGSDVTFSSFYGTNGATEIASQTELNITQYDNVGTLTSMTSGYFRRDKVVITSDGRINIIFGAEEFSSSAAAQIASDSPTPTFIEPTGFPVAAVIVEEGVGISSIVDIRPQSGSGGSGSSGVSSHSALSDLDKPADHTWAMLVDGTRAMTGALNMNSNNITNAGTINSINIASHAARHQPGGADALSTETPTAVLAGASAAAGSENSLARSDHQHGIATGTPSSIGASNVEGTSSSVARLDHVHAHGDQTGGTTHSAATTSVAGFLSSTDKSKLDGIEANATATPLSSTAPVNVTKATASAGVATAAARQDHKHDVTTAAPSASAVQIGNSASEGTATSLARSDHQHSVSAGTPVSVGTASAAGSAATFARSDHVHSGLTRASGDFNTFTAKTSLAKTDLVLIEDSAASNAKKKVNAEYFQGVLQSQYTRLTADTTTTSTSFVDLLSLNITTGANHLVIHFTVAGRNSSGGREVNFRLEIDGVVKTGTTFCGVAGNRTTSASFIFKESIFAGSHTVKIQWKVETGTGSILPVTYPSTEHAALYIEEHVR